MVTRSRFQECQAVVVLVGVGVLELVSEERQAYGAFVECQ